MKNSISRRKFIRLAAGSSAGLWAASRSLPTVFGQEDQPLPEGAAGKLTVIHRTEYFEEVQNLFRSTVEGFADGAGIELDISTANPEAFGDFLAKMQAAVQAGNPPDLAYTTNISIAQMHLLGLLEDLTDVYEEAVSRYGAAMPGTSPAANAAFDGQWMAIPFQSQVAAWFGRRGALEAAGYTPADIDTWDTRREAALAISDPDNQFWGWGLTPNQSGDGFGFLMSVINGFGGSITDESGMVVTFDSPETLAAVEWLTETYTSEEYAPMLPPGILSWTDVSNNENYLAGTIGLTQNAFSVYAAAKRDDNPVFEDTVVLRYPLTTSGERQENGTNGWFTVFKGSQNVDAAKELILTLLDPENFTPMAAAGGGLFLPAYEGLWTEELLESDPNFATLQEILSIEDPYIGYTWPAAPNAAHGAVRAASIPNQMMADITAGRMTPEEAVKDAHQKIVDIFEEGGIMQ